MHNLLQKIIPHIIILAILLIINPKLAVYIFSALYAAGIIINEKKAFDKKNKPKNEDKNKWWEILGTNPEASVSECARVRKLLSKIYHPDGGQAPNADAMLRINSAFEKRASLPDTVDYKNIN